MSIIVPAPSQRRLAKPRGVPFSSVNLLLTFVWNPKANPNAAVDDVLILWLCSRWSHKPKITSGKQSNNKPQDSHVS